MTFTRELLFPEVDPDEACRALWRVKAGFIWDRDETRLACTLNHCRVEVVENPTPSLVIFGPTDDVLRATARQLGYDDAVGVANHVKDMVSARQ